ncbi:hypothetical protein B0H17DRAFT_867704, partial [Mycena rosella]
RAEGLSEGKRLGFVAGREFGEKQAAKMSNNSSSRVLVDVGTDSPIAELSPPAPLSSVRLVPSAQIVALPAISIPSTAPTPPLTWADESYHIYAPEPPEHPLPPSRDFSALRSNSSSSTPFSTLQYRA